MTMLHSSDDRMNDLLPTVDQSAHESLDAIATAVARGTALADIPEFDCLDTGAGRAVGTVAIDGVPNDVVLTSSTRLKSWDSHIGISWFATDDAGGAKQPLLLSSGGF
jgi:hypothetical protein